MRKAGTILVLIWLAFLARGAFYVLAMPLWEGFDEYAHFAFVDYLSAFGNLPSADERVSDEIDQSLKLVPLPWMLKHLPGPSATHDVFWQLPVEERAQRAQALKELPSPLRNESGNAFLYEGKQPPLYYWLATTVLKLIAAEGLVSKVFALRLFNVLLASLLVPITYFIARAVFGTAGPALGATAILTSMPGLFITITRVSNDALAAVVFALLTWLMIRAAPDKIQRWFLLGLMLGAGLLTKAYFVAAVPAVLLLALATLFKTDKRKRSTVLLPVLLSLMLPLLVSGWWYARSLIGPSGIWVDAAPTESVPIGTLLSNSFKMDWWTAAGGAFNAHIWLGGWSFLGIRSWMYNVFRAVFFLSFVGAMVALIRPRTVERRNLLILALLYVGFWLALMYHAFINFVNSGIPATTGYYLYAAVVPEVLILAIGLYSVVPRRLTRLVLAAVASLFVLLEMYATHFVLIPYYTGIIRHNPDGGLPAFHVSQALDIGWGEIVGRMHLNRPELLSLGMFVAIWIAYICSSVLLPVIAPALLDREGHNTNRRQDSQQRPASRKESLSR